MSSHIVLKNRKETTTSKKLSFKQPVLTQNVYTKWKVNEMLNLCELVFLSKVEFCLFSADFKYSSNIQTF